MSSSWPATETVVMNASLQKPGYRALRTGRISLPAQHYLITTVCHERDRRFLDGSTASAVTSKLQEHSLWEESQLLCWVLMPDHLHMLIELGACRSLSALIQRVKCVTAHSANQAGGRSGSVWMPGFHDRALRAEDEMVGIARYVIENPIRAGLAKEIGEYPYWGSVWSAGAGDLF